VCPVPSLVSRLLHCHARAHVDAEHVDADKSATARGRQCMCMWPAQWHVACALPAWAPAQTFIAWWMLMQVYVLMDTRDGARRLRETVHRRVYDGRELEATHIQPAHFYMLPMPITR
jgi:hypothetical protein